MEYIRKATHEDIERIRFIVEQCWDFAAIDTDSRKKIALMVRDFYSYGRLNNEISDKFSVFLLVIDEELAVAFATYRIDHNDGISTALNALYCLPQAQGKRLDELLVNEVIKDTIIAGGNKIFVILTDYTGPAGLFTRFGFELIKTVDPTKQELEILVMSKTL